VDCWQGLSRGQIKSLKISATLIFNEPDPAGAFLFIIFIIIVAIENYLSSVMVSVSEHKELLHSVRVAGSNDAAICRAINRCGKKILLAEAARVL
jgi:hypothetical protein